MSPAGGSRNFSRGSGGGSSDCRRKWGSEGASFRRRRPGVL